MAINRVLVDPESDVTNSDYDAIESAIMESSRGRWFLAEYARRNRHANTQLLLSAINNIKETLDSFKGTSPPYLISTQVSSAYCADQVRTPPIPRRISEVGPN